MRRRSGFTLVEVLVAMALILFIMTILGSAFSAASQTVSDLKSAGDLAERLRGAATVIKRDLEANQLSDVNGKVVPLSKLWNTSINPNPPPPDMGFLRIYEGLSSSTPYVAGALAGDEGVDANGLHSYYETTTSLAYTISLIPPVGNGTRRNDFLSAQVGGGSPLLYAFALGGPYQNPDTLYEDTPGVYNSTSAEVALFLVPTPDKTDSSNGLQPQQLYGLYRRQLLTVPVQPGTNHWSPPANTAGPVSNYVEVSTIPTAGEVPLATPPSSFNSLKDLVYPPKRFWMDRGNLAGAYQAPGRYATMGESYPNYQAADLLMSDVVSMDVRVLVQAGNVQGSDFEDLFDITNQNRKAPGTATQWYFPPNNPVYANANGPRVFDTWAGTLDPNNGTYDYTTWSTPGLRGIPIYKDNIGNGNPISIRAIQITLRVWDFKTKKTRQVTIVQEM